MNATHIDDPLFMLVAAHQQLRTHLHNLVRAGRLFAVGKGDFRLVPQLSQALKFLQTDVALHARDEEDSLHPRLRGKLRDPQSHFAYLLQHIEKDHAELAELQEKAGEAARALIRQVPLESFPACENIKQPLVEFRQLVNQLYRIYTSHMLVEERDIFPAIQVIFTPQERAELAAEMCERRAANGARFTVEPVVRSGISID
ncbi:MAG: hemerythrin domain-containing protein [Planctomycetes bacterium]|nr:hemerythrin domain-containing protein [Planctomycetota bacterium]